MPLRPNGGSFFDVILTQTRRNMKIVDRLFEIIFSRYRRKLGESNIESAWYQASNRVTAYISSPILAVEFLILVVVYFPVIRGTVLDSRSALLLTGTGIFLIASFIVGRGFRRFLTNPPSLVSEETRSDTRFVFIFRAVSFGTIGAVCLVAFALHKGGFPAIR
jgi:hypothetical protein